LRQVLKRTLPQITAATAEMRFAVKPAWQACAKALTGGSTPALYRTPVRHGSDCCAGDLQQRAEKTAGGALPDSQIMQSVWGAPA
jgi:hypothetical protein